MEQRHGQHGAKPVHHLSIQKQEAENTLAHREWSPEPSTGDSLLEQGSNGTVVGVLGAGGRLHLHGCYRLRARSLLHGLPIKLPQHGFSLGCDQKKENPDQGCPHLSFLCLRSFYLTPDTQSKYINQHLNPGQRKPVLWCAHFIVKDENRFAY